MGRHALARHRVRTAAFAVVVISSTIGFSVPAVRAAAPVGPSGASTPALVVPGSGSVAPGNDHACVLTAVGGVKCWGQNEEVRQVGDGTIFNRAEPVDVVGLESGVTSLSAGYWHSCAVTATGAVRCWGAGYDGQLGVAGSPYSLAVPGEVVGLTSPAVQVDAGWRHSCAVMVEGRVVCWGTNLEGELGNGTDIDSLAVDVVGLTSGVVDVAVGSRHSCAVTAAGGVKCWGGNGQGQLGDGSPVLERWTPVDVVGLSSGVVAIEAGENHTCALTVAGGVTCWGQNSGGELGDGTTTSRWTPVDVVGLATGVSSLSLAMSRSCALTTAGEARCWGGRTTTPTPVSGLPSDLVAVSWGGATGCAFRSNGALLCWGRAGDGTFIDRAAPVDVSGSFYRPECPTLVAEEHTAFSLSDGYTVGSTATFTASAGYGLMGPSSLVCEPGAAWSGAAPVADVPPTIVPGSGSGWEGDADTAEVLVPVELDRALVAPVTVAWTTVDVAGAPPGQAVPGDDYVPASGVVTVPSGEMVAEVPITVLGDLVRESDEYIVIAFSDPSFGALSGFWGLGFAAIVDDDEPAVVPGTVFVTEGTGASTFVDLPVSLSIPSTEPVTVEWTTVPVVGGWPNQAEPGSDYVAVDGSLTFAPGQTQASVTIEIVGDGADEPGTEHFVVAFHHPIGAHLGGEWGLGLVLIDDDD